MSIIEQYLIAKQEFESALLYSSKLEPLLWFLWIGDNYTEMNLIEIQLMELGRS